MKKSFDEFEYKSLAFVKADLVIYLNCACIYAFNPTLIGIVFSILHLDIVVMPTVEQHLGLVAMTTQPSFMTDLQSVNSNTAVVSQSAQSTAAVQHAPQNLSSSQSSEVQVRGFD